MEFGFYPKVKNVAVVGIMAVELFHIATRRLIRRLRLHVVISILITFLAGCAVSGAGGERSKSGNYPPVSRDFCNGRCAEFSPDGRCVRFTAGIADVCREYLDSSLIYEGISNRPRSPAELQQIADSMVRLCLGGGRIESISGHGVGEMDLSLKSTDANGNRHGEFKFSRSSAEGLTQGINSALTQIAADQADKVRACLQPVRDRLLYIMFNSQ